MDPKRLRKQYVQILPKLNQALSYVQDKIGGLPPSDFTVETNVKPYSSVKRKVEEDQVSQVSELSDLVRGRIYFSADYMFEDVLKILKQLLGQFISSIDKKRGKTQLGLNYHGVVHIDLIMDGIQFELQIIPQEFKPYKPLLHQIYEKLREDDKLSDHQKEFLKQFHNRLYSSLDEQAQVNRDH